MSYAKLLAGLREIGDPTVVRKRNHIAFQGEVPRYAHYILDGAVKAYVIAPDGSQTVVDIFAKHSMLPSAWLTRSASMALFYYDALTDVRTVKFTRQAFEEAIERDSEMRDDYLRYLANTQTALMLRATGLSQTHATHKVCYALYYLAYRYGTEQAEGVFDIPIPLTHEIIGNFIGQSRENTAKTIKALSDDGILSYDAKIYTVNVRRFEDFLGEDGFRTLVG